MREIAQRELRNDAGGVLRQVEAGASLRITVRGRPVADLVPIGDASRRHMVPRTRVESMLAANPPDPNFAADVDRAIGQTVDELR